MAKFRGKSGVWMIYRPDNLIVSMISEQIVTIVVNLTRVTDDHTIGFWPNDMKIGDAVEWWKEESAEDLDR